jgi:predicted nucleic acid-binding protein
MAQQISRRIAEKLGVRVFGLIGATVYMDFR